MCQNGCCKYRKGYALLTVVGLMAVSGIVAYAALTLSRSRGRSAHMLVNRAKARWAAEGAVAICKAQFLREANDINSDLFDRIRRIPPHSPLTFKPDSRARSSMYALLSRLGITANLSFSAEIADQRPYLPDAAFPHPGERSFRLRISASASVKGAECTIKRTYAGRIISLSPPIAGPFALWVDELPSEPNHPVTGPGNPRIAISAPGDSGRIYLGSRCSLNVAWESDAHLLPAVSIEDHDSFELIRIPRGICSNAATDPAFESLDWRRMPSGPAWINLTDSSYSPDNMPFYGYARLRWLSASGLLMNTADNVLPLPAGLPPEHQDIPQQVLKQYHNYASSIEHTDFMSFDQKPLLYRNRQLPRHSSQMMRPFMSRVTRIVGGFQDLIKLFGKHEGPGYSLDLKGNIILVPGPLYMPPITKVHSSGMIISDGSISISGIADHPHQLTLITTKGDMFVSGRISAALMAVGQNSSFRVQRPFNINGLLAAHRLPSPQYGGIIRYNPVYDDQTPESLHSILSPLITEQSISFRRTLR